MLRCRAEVSGWKKPSSFPSPELTLVPSDVASPSRARSRFCRARSGFCSLQLGARPFDCAPKLTLASPRPDSTSTPSHSFLDPKPPLCMPDCPRGRPGIPDPCPPPGSAAVEKFLANPGFISLCQLAEDKQASHHQEEREPPVHKGSVTEASSPDFRAGVQRKVSSASPYPSARRKSQYLTASERHQGHGVLNRNPLEQEQQPTIRATSLSEEALLKGEKKVRTVQIGFKTGFSTLCFFPYAKPGQ